MDSKKKRKVTAADVARLAGVSQPTVSRVFDENCKIKTNPESVKKVLSAAKKLGYVPNRIARTMTSGKSGIIGIVVPDSFNVFYYNALQILSGLLLEAGFQTMLYTTAPKDNINTIMERLRQYQVDGVIVTGSALFYPATGKIKNDRIPVVLLNGYMEEMELCAVQSDQWNSGRIMAEYLISVGHERFAYVNSENSPHKNYLIRQEGFVTTLKDHGVSDIRIVPAGYSYESGLAAGEQLLKESTTPDAIFCSGDLNAMGVMDAVRRSGKYKLGKDISVAGYDAPVLTDFDAYKLTAMTQDTDALCRDCVDLIKSLIENPGGDSRIITHPMKLTVRESSR